MSLALLIFSFFFFNDTATTEIYTLSLHDALPISFQGVMLADVDDERGGRAIVDEVIANPLDFPRFPGVTASGVLSEAAGGDRKSTRLNSSHGYISYAVFCLKKKKKK